MFLDHFKKLNTVEEEGDDFNENDPDNITELNSELNREYTRAEIKVIKSLQNNKACGSDPIINEFLKFSSEKLLDIFTKIFSIVFKTGLIPKAWSEGIICTFYKNKGYPENPDNYRGITI